MKIKANSWHYELNLISCWANNERPDDWTKFQYIYNTVIHSLLLLTAIISVFAVCFSIGYAILPMSMVLVQVLLGFLVIGTSVVIVPTTERLIIKARQHTKTRQHNRILVAIKRFRAKYDGPIKVIR